MDQINKLETAVKAPTTLSPEKTLENALSEIGDLEKHYSEKVDDAGKIHLNKIRNILSVAVLCAASFSGQAEGKGLEESIKKKAIAMLMDKVTANPELEPHLEQISKEMSISKSFDPADILKQIKENKITKKIDAIKEAATALSDVNGGIDSKASAFVKLSESVPIKFLQKSPYTMLIAKSILNFRKDKDETFEALDKEMSEEDRKELKDKAREEKIKETSVAVIEGILNIKTAGFYSLIQNMIKNLPKQEPSSYQQAETN